MGKMERDRIWVVRTGRHRCGELLELRFQMCLNSKPLAVVRPVIPNGGNIVSRGSIDSIRLVEVDREAGETCLWLSGGYEYRVDVDLERLGKTAKSGFEAENIISISLGGS